MLGVYKMKKFFENFMDGKFIAALIAMIAGIMGLLKCDDSIIALITNIVAIALPAIAYVVTTGILDWNKINTAIKQILDIIDLYMNDEATEEEQNEQIAGAKQVDKEREVICKIADILKTVVRK